MRILKIQTILYWLACIVDERYLIVEPEINKKVYIKIRMSVEVSKMNIS